LVHDEAPIPQALHWVVLKVKNPVVKHPELHGTLDATHWTHEVWLTVYPTLHRIGTGPGLQVIWFPLATDEQRVQTPWAAK